MSKTQKNVQAQLRIHSFSIDQEVDEPSRLFRLHWKLGNTVFCRSKTRSFDQESKEVKFDDVFRLRTSLVYDETRKQIEGKQTLIELMDATTEGVVAQFQFDIGEQSMRITDDEMTTLVDEASE